MAALVAGCSAQHSGAPGTSASTSASAQSSARAAGPCTLPHFGYLLEWRHEPGKPDRAYRVSDVDQSRCEPTLNNWTANLTQGPGFCYMIGFDSDNVGYQYTAVPAPRLPKALDTIGDGC
ncbi:hypothetical protein [Mycolicibacterium sp. CBMA 226]|uniref:hypothetical protein n=1 Tax=Mycolicibacterium sp. CBMA 226 TaxID=2606611 RepID=UPI0012DD4AC2|nr:hypothetical protein [Mycolicibacterium sp. CBMA 226]MUL78614.1 hypothetical protein [Mycolicibacterium sp. CBMA 226]